MRFASNPLLLLRHFVFTLLVAAGLTGLAAAGLFWLGMKSTIPVYAIAAVALVSCVAQVAVKGRVRVEMTDDELVIARPLEEDMRFSLSRHGFSSRVVAHSVNLVPVQTERILIVHDGDETREVVLSNLSKKSFDRIMAALRTNRAAALAAIERDGDAPGEITFDVPKEEMLGDFRRMIRVLIILGVVLSAGLVGFIGYLLAKAGNAAVAAPMLVKVLGSCLFLFAGFGIPVFMTYKKRERGIPAVVRIGGDWLEMGEERFSPAEIRRVVATPPDYVAGDFVASRTVTVQTDRGKTRFNFGVRAAGGMWKTVFEEYGEMCDALEAAAIRGGFEFAFDL